MEVKHKILATLLAILLLSIVFAFLFYSKIGNTSPVLNLWRMRKAALKGDTQALSTLKDLAQQGDIEAQYQLGMFYYGQRGMLKEASVWYIKAAEQGNRNALSYLYTIVEKNDDAEAMKCILQCEDKDSPSAQHWLGKLYSRKKSVFYNQEEAQKWFNKVIEAAELGNPEAQLQLGLMYNDGDGVKKDSKEAFNWYVKAAEKNNKAFFYIGDAYDKGLGVRKDRLEAFNWYLKAAEEGNTYAQNRLASMYEKGDAVTQDRREAIKWRLKSIEGKNEESASNTIDIIYYRAKDGDSEALSALHGLAEKGYSDAQYHLGLIYHYGYGVAKNYNEAGKWYLKAFKLGNTDMLTQIDQLDEKGIPEVMEIMKYLAENGNKHAQAKLGLAYARGNGVKQDYNESLKWLNKSASQNYELGQFLLGLMYYHGNGVKQDYVEAARLIIKAEQTGLMVAMQAMRDANLLYGAGIMYRDGIDVRQDKKLATELFYKAAGGGSTEANFILGDMYEYGKEVKQNHTKAIEYYLVAARSNHQQALLRLRYLAEHGNTNAMYNLGLIYGEKEESYNEQLKWLDMAAKKGHLESIKTMGILAESDGEALKFLRTYAEQGNTQAQLDLANIYYEGGSEFLEIEPNFQEAAKWFRKSAEQGNITAQYRLGMMYLNGEGLEKNKDEATNWLLKAANKGDKATRNQLAELGIYPEVKSAPTFKTNGYILGNNVNLRASPSTNARVVTKFNNGHLISIGQKNGDWYFIKTANGKEGWVFRKYIRFK